MITSLSRIDRISETDQEMWADALAKVILSVSTVARPTLPAEATADQITTYNKELQLDAYKRTTARDMSMKIPGIIEVYVYSIVNSGTYFCRPADHVDAPAEQLAEDKEWILYDAGGSATSTSTRQTIEDAVVVLGGLFNILATPTKTIV